MNQNRKHAPVSWKRGLVSLLVAMLVLNLCMPGIVTRAEELPAQEATAQIPEEGTVLPEGGAAEENLQPLTEEDSQEEITKEDTKEDTIEEEASEDTTKEDTTTAEEASEDTTKEDTTTEEESSEDITKEDTTTENGAPEDTTKEDTTTGEGTTEEIPSEDTVAGEVASNEIQVGTDDAANGKVTADNQISEVDALFARLMAAATYEELDAMMEAMTEEEYALMGQFTDEQNAALHARVEELSNKEINVLADMSIEQGTSGTRTEEYIEYYSAYRIQKDGATISSDSCGITLTDNDEDTITVSVSETTPVGEYTIQYGNNYTSRWGSYFDVKGEFTIQVTAKVSSEGTVVPTKKMTFDKTVTDTDGDGIYDLKLTLSGAVGSEVQKAKLDILFIVDTSGSMEYGMSSDKEASYPNRRIDKVASAMKSLVDTISANSDKLDVMYSLVQFDGPSSIYGEGSQRNDAGTLVGWTSNGASITSVFNQNYTPVNGTNYEAGITQGINQLNASSRSSAQKIVIFLTDGNPTAANNQQYSESKNATFMTAANNAVAKLSCNQFYCIGAGPDFGNGELGVTNLNALINKVGTDASATAPSTKKYYQATDTTALNKAFEEITSNTLYFLCEDVTITDTLHHVGGKTAVNRMVEVTNVDTVKVTVYKDDEIIAGPAKEVSLDATDTNEASKLTASYDQTTGVLKLDFPDKYQLEPDYTYVLSAEIAPTEKAYEEYRKTGYTESGESNTGTHSGDFGFYSNDSAMVTYTYQDEESYEVYAHPVVQLKPGTLVINKTIAGMNPEQLSELEFNVTIQYPGKDATTQTIPFADFKPTENEGTYTYPMTGLSPNTIYSVQESGLDVEGYQVAVDAKGGDKVENYVVSGTVEKGATDTVEFTNTYSLANTTITLDKDVAGNMGSYSDEFTFNVTINGEAYSDEPIKLTHLSDPVEITVPIGAKVVITEVASGNYVASATVDEKEVNLTGETDKTLTIDAVAAAGHVVVFTNTNEAVIETGLRVDSFPMYLLMSTMIVFGGLLLIRKRRCGDWM